jgi:hypothetical protein
MTPSKRRCSNSPTFLLSKWYADCVSDSGDVLIAYYGVARWRGTALHYSSLLELSGDAAPRASYSIRRGTPPSFDGTTLSWTSKALDFAGSWASIDASQTITLLSSNKGVVEWSCLQPRAQAEIRRHGEKILTGWGYSERVHVTVPPWAIPIQQLNWGRFLSDTDSLEAIS